MSTVHARGGEGGTLCGSMGGLLDLPTVTCVSCRSLLHLCDRCGNPGELCNADGFYYCGRHYPDGWR